MIKITIEGPQGCGKTTLANEILQWIMGSNLECSIDPENISVSTKQTD